MAKAWWRDSDYELFDRLTKERDEARAEVERLREEFATQADISSSTIARMKQQLREARAEAAMLEDRLSESRAEVEALTDERDELLVRVEDQGAELRATREAYNGARTDVPALIARVRELEERLLTAEERLEQRTRERDHERALLECAPWATYSEGETLLLAQAAEARQLAQQMMDERDEAKAHVVCLEALLREKTEECDELDEERREAWQHVQNNMSHVLLKRAHGALADAGDVEVPPLTEPIDETIRAIVRERDQLRAECAALRREIAQLMDDH